ncbi:transport between ER and Golgi ATPase protein, partial [Linderina macrospora]
MSRNYSYDRIMNPGGMEPYGSQQHPPQYRSSPQRQVSEFMAPGDARQMRVGKCPDNTLALTNLLAVSSQDFDNSVRYVCINSNYIFNVRPVSELPSGMIGPSRIQRNWAQFSINQEVLVEAMSNPGADPKSNVFAISMDVDISFLTPNQETPLRVDSEEVSQLLRTNFGNQIFSAGQPFVFDFRGYNLKATVTSLAVVPLDVLQDSKGAGGSGYDNAPAADYGILSSLTTINVSKAHGSLIDVRGSATKHKANAIIQPDFKFEDMGIGGLDKEFSNIFRRAFASRIFPPDLVDKLGIQHVKGILLYGPPGTGKTLMARQIGKMLNAVEPLIVSGPEILNKYVGQSEENVRKLFEPAEKEYKEKGDESQLHIIILDELDAICKQRGSKNDGTGVGDSVVNQLLAKMDGVDQLNNILIIGMTNRKELIDDALLRPGRLEVQIEVGLPDEDGRLQIIKIHTAKIRDNNILD